MDVLKNYKDLDFIIIGKKHEVDCDKCNDKGEYVNYVTHHHKYTISVIFRIPISGSNVLYETGYQCRTFEVPERIFCKMSILEHWHFEFLSNTEINFKKSHII
ncbi:MAG: hypothetical protein U0L18_02900 [Acutalibacteraceae bacterium]|nr:hypothetical protein [Acutalibacteraceae bacterium]